MTDVVVERLRIACRAGRSREGEALRLRARLERIASRQLPTTLAGATDGAEDATFDRIVVALDFDPGYYDDVTVALLWADRIRRAVRAAGARGALQVSDQAETRWSRLDAESSTASQLMRASPLAERSLAGDKVALEELLVTLAQAGKGGPDRALDGLAREQRLELAARLERLAAELEAADNAAAEGAVMTDAATRRRHVAQHDTDGAAESHADTAARRHTERVAVLRHTAGRLRRAAPGSPGGWHQPGATDWDTDGEGVPGIHSSAVAGLAFLYPWLGGFLVEAVERDPALDPRAVRRLALARLFPEEPTADADPLVRFLAGDDVGSPASPVAQPAVREPIDAAAAAVLRAFASALPGFERSTGEFIRREFLIRRGALSTACEPAELLADAMPLDVALARYPYPIGIMQLPGSPTLSVRLQRR